jgi:hypothetical protein
LQLSWRKNGNLDFPGEGLFYLPFFCYAWIPDPDLPVYGLLAEYPGIHTPQPERDLGLGWSCEGCFFFFPERFAPEKRKNKILLVEKEAIATFESPV